LKRITIFVFGLNSRYADRVFEGKRSLAFVRALAKIFHWMKVEIFENNNRTDNERKL
jgi:hypothetical protein